MARSPYKFAKRQKELAKKKKQEEKRQRKLEKKTQTEDATVDDSVEVIVERDGQVVNFVLDKSMDKFNFTEKCLKSLGKTVKTVL